MKIISYYLPQYHEVKENNEWWGEGFTEWVNVKNAKSYFNGHNQPRIPLNNNYYDLTNVETLRWQAQLANKYDVYGFSFYHYWMGGGKQLLQKPAEILLKNKDIDINFCFSWANHDWMRTWGSKEKTLLMKVEYGNENEWKKHFDYLLPFFKDNRYIRIDNQPVFTIYDPKGIENGVEMIKFWQKLAISNGLQGIYFIYQNNEFHQHQDDELKNLFQRGIEYQPGKAFTKFNNSPAGYYKRIKHLLADKLNIDSKNMKLTYDYDEVWKEILNSKPASKNSIPGAFVDWDDSPRRKERGSVTLGVTPEKFEKYLTLQLENAKKNYDSDYIFMFAWNEWGESGYLEPDSKNNYEMLEAVKNALQNTSEI